MASALDTILDHIQKDPTAKHLFHDDEDSKTATIIENETQPTSNFVDLVNNPTQEDSQMAIREYSGSRRQLSSGVSPQKSHINVTNNQPSPMRSPPSKKEQSEINKTSANPDHIDQERGST
jgi:hypothetical protein